MPSSAPTPEQQRLLDRMHTQRQRLLVWHTQHQQERQRRRTQPLGAGLLSSPLVDQVIRLARQHPLAVAGLVGVAWAAGPKRLTRWAGVVLPLLLRLRT